MKLTVCTTGTFDYHINHAIALRRMSGLGRLKVGVLSDDFVEEYKGTRPYFSQSERANTIRRLGYHAQVVDDQRSFFISSKADIIAVGSDWRPLSRYLDQIKMTQQELDTYNISIVFTPRVEGVSTSDLVQRVKDRI